MPLTPNMGLQPVDDIDQPADIQVFDDNLTVIDLHDHTLGKGVPVRRLAAGPLAGRPSPGNAGHVYLATDTSEVFFDNGIDWFQISGGEVWSEWTLSSTVPDGTTVTFNIGGGSAAAKVQVKRNGLVLTEGVDYTHTSGDSTVTFLVAPPSGAQIAMSWVAA